MREDFGAPDFKISNGKIIGYIETKKIDVDIKNLFYIKMEKKLRMLLF
ncbi:hypothetical protein ACO3VM_08730 [Methanocaldococcus sp. 10A]